MNERHYGIEQDHGTIEGTAVFIDPGFDPDSFGHKETIEGHTP
jgi:hypothetical protein